MSGGHFNNEEFALKMLADMIENDEGNSREETVEKEKVEWHVGLFCELLRDLYDLLHAYDYWVCGDTGEEAYREVETKFLEKWDISQ